MKKMAIGLMTVLIFILNTVFAQAAEVSQISEFNFDENAYNEARFTLSAIGVMTDNEYGSFEPSRNITRAEFTDIVANMMGAEDVEYKNNFIDVPSFYTNVGFVVDSGYMSGYTDNTFRPDNWITFKEAVTVMIRLLGYDAAARMQGGYPDGYLGLAFKTGLLDDTDINMDAYATRAELAIVIYNAMSVKILDADGEKSDTTLLDNRLAKLGLKSARGLVTGVDCVDINGNEIQKNEISIDGYKYNFKQYADVNMYLGATVDYYYSDEEDTVTSVQIVRHEKLEIDAYDVINADLNNIKYYKDKNQKSDKSAKISENVTYVYNHRVVDEFDGTEANIDSGRLTLVDTDRDSDYDIVLIDEYFSFIIDDVNYEDNIIYLKDRLLNERPYVRLYEDEKGYESYLTDKSGKMIDIESVKADGTVCVYQSIDKSYVKLITVDEYAEGIVTSVSDDEITVGETTYEIATDNNSPLVELMEIDLGKNYVFCLDISGKIFGIQENKNTDENYGFIANIKVEDGIRGKVKVRMVNGRTFRSSVDQTKDRYDATRNYMSFANTGCFIAELSEKVNFDGTKIESKKILNYVNDGDVVAYKMEGDKITALKPFYANGNKNAVRKLHYDTKTFGGQAGGAFFFDEETLFFINPLNKAEEKNFSIKIQVANGNNVMVTGYGVDEETKIAKFAVLTTDREYYSFSNTVTANTKIGIVKKAFGGVNLDGESTYNIVGYSEGEDITKYCLDIPELNNKAYKLKPGDVFYCFSAGGGDNVGDILLIASLKNEEFAGPVVTTLGNTQVEKIYGRLYDFKKDTLLDTSEMATDIITVSVTGDGSDAVEYHVTDKQKTTYYIYDPAEKSVQLFDGSLINSVQNTDIESCDNVFVYKSGEKIRVVVFVKGGNR